MKATDTTATLFTEVGLLLKTRLQEAISLPFSQCQTLWFVAKHEQTSMQDIARQFKIRAPSVTFLVEELAQAGLVTRHTNAKDRRKVELALTKKGKEAFKTFEAKRSAVLSKLFKSLEEKDREELSRILQKVIDSA